MQSIRTTALDAEPAPDLAEVEIYSGILRTFLNDGTGGSFRTGQVIGLGDRTFSLAAGNIDGDALGDLATHVGWGQVRVYSSDGEGGLRTYWTSPHLGQAAFNLELSDFDRDGDDDLFVGTFGDGELRIFENRLGEISSEPFGLAWTGRVPGEGYSGTAADIDGDGAPDLIVGDLNGLRVLRNETEPPAHPFAWFEIELLDLQLSPRRGAHDRFTAAGTFVLGERSGQLDPPDEALTIAVGSVELSIPAGSFEWREGGFAFEGWVGTVSVVAYLQENGPGTYAFAVRAGPVDLRGAGEPESVKLRVGNDRGAATVRLGGRLRHGDGRTSLPGRMGAP